MANHATIKTIKTNETFEKLFPINPEIMNAISKNMKSAGYDDSKPIDLWNGVVIDGHTRLEAAKNAGLETVAVFTHEFGTEDQAIEYAIHNQRDRRNITNADLARWIKELDKRQKKGATQTRSDQGKFMPKASTDAYGNSPTKTAAETAAIVGTSQATVERFRVVQDRAGDEAVKKIEAGESTIHAEYEKVKKSKQETRKEGKPESKRKPANKITGAMTFATYAITQLKRITGIYSDADEAFDTVTEWIRQNRRKTNE